MKTCSTQTPSAPCDVRTRVRDRFSQDSEFLRTPGARALRTSGGSVFPRVSVFLVLWIMAFLPAGWAQREPVLNQIDEPHAYYFREMYLPQLTTGPSAVAWFPDSKSVVYSMAGSLWQQDTASQEAEQLTAGPGYDYQPDVSPDGRWIIYAKYDHSAIELWALDLKQRQPHALTSDGAVNVEPRFSPDGKRIVFVSTSFHGRFHIFTARFQDGSLQNVERLTGENRSSLPRYYYSAFDQEISPVWARDGNEILFVSNRGHVYGTGGFWRMKASPGDTPREIHYEETTWKARPDFSPDDKRIVYASIWAAPGTSFGSCPRKAATPSRSLTVSLTTSTRAGRPTARPSLLFQIVTGTLPSGCRERPAARKPSLSPTRGIISMRWEAFDSQSRTSKAGPPRTRVCDQCGRPLL